MNMSSPLIWKKKSTFKTKGKALYGSTLEVKKKNPQKYCDITCMMRGVYISLMFKQFSNSSSKKKLISDDF